MKIKNIPLDLAKANDLKRIGDNVYELPALWLDGEVIKLIDQRHLPGKFVLYEAKDFHDVAFVIRDMVIRGAPAIGAMAAYGMAQASTQGHDMNSVTEVLKGTRPTAFDLFYAVDQMNNAINNGKDPYNTAELYVQDIIRRCKQIGEFGDTLIESGNKILTHCNAGALATVDYGTALAPIRIAHEHAKNISVFVDETRPRLQGAKLTAWELYHEGIEHSLIVDNAAGFYLSRGEIDLVIVGADRIAANGDAANKIGTYEKAVLAKENNVPFYVAAPVSTFDLAIDNGSKIPIEEREQSEVLFVNDSPITIDGVTAKNPAFDVTPNKYITAFITEFGIIKPEDIRSVLDKKKN